MVTLATAMNKWGCCCFRSGLNKQKFGVQESILIVHQIIQALHCFKNHIRLCNLMCILCNLDELISFGTKPVCNDLGNLLMCLSQKVPTTIAEGTHTMLHHKGDISNFLH
jgi:hypothetical protein